MKLSCIFDIDTGNTYVTTFTTSHKRPGGVIDNIQNFSNYFVKFQGFFGVI